jgi:hypothetical protein
MRKLKFHENKLLKKVDFLQWKRENNHRELQVRLAPSLEGRLVASCAMDAALVTCSIDVHSEEQCVTCSVEPVGDSVGVSAHSQNWSQRACQIFVCHNLFFGHPFTC